MAVRTELLINWNFECVTVYGVGRCCGLVSALISRLSSRG